MRQRKLKNLETKYEAFEDIIVYEPSELRGRWNELAGSLPIYIEIGCGKGKFISEMAAREPERFFVAVEGNRSVMMRALEKIRDGGLTNVVFVPEFAGDMTEWFADGEVSGIYLNFSDPLPKNYWYKRRLTYRDRLKSYFRVLTDDGIITFKTDNTGLFDWTLIEIQAADLKILDMTRDLHADPEANADNIETEYEAKYSGLGEKIKRVVIGRRESAGTADENKKCKEGEEEKMNKSMAAINGRDIPKEDRVFAVVARATEAIKKKGRGAVINGTAGALADDSGKLIVLKSVSETLRSLSDEDFAQYAPIAGTPEFKKAILKAALGSYEPKSYTAVVGTPGGTGSIRNAVANYSCPGDKILTHSWHWAPYKSIADEMGRGIERFEMFDENGGFNLADFEYKVKKLLRNQDRLVVILNTPANNPTGYSLNMEDWQGVKKVMDEVDMEKKVALVLDVAYMDFAGEPDEVRRFLSVVDNLRSNILPIIAYSASKTFTMYGFRCAAMICLAHNPEAAEEFEKVCSFSSRSTWSNSPRAPQEVISRIYADEELLAQVEKERAEARDMLLARGRAFEEAAKEVGLKIVPFSAGFFVTVPCNDTDTLCEKLEEQDIFFVPFTNGVRVTVASIAEADCRRLPAIIKKTMDELGLHE